MFLSTLFILQAEKEGVNLNNHFTFPQAQNVTPLCVTCIY